MLELDNAGPFSVTDLGIKYIMAYFTKWTKAFAFSNPKTTSILTNLELWSIIGFVATQLLWKYTQIEDGTLSY